MQERTGSHERAAIRGPDWLLGACRCDVCGSLLILTEGRWVTCLEAGHVGLIGWRLFAERILTARKRARTVSRVNLNEHTAVRRAWEIVRGASPATAPAAAQCGDEFPTASLFDLLPPETGPEGATHTPPTGETEPC